MDTDVSALKAGLRQQIKSQAAEYSTRNFLHMSSAVVQQLTESPEFREAKCISLYHSLPGEVYTHAIIEQWYRSKLILLPVTHASRLTLHPYHGSDSMRKGVFGISEPTTNEFTDYDSIDLMIVPGLAFDRAGHRLGYGRGYYDKLLATTQPQGVASAGLCFPFQVVERVPTDRYDMPVDMLFAGI